MKTLLREPKHGSEPPTARRAAPDPQTSTYRFDAFRTFLGTTFFLVLTTFLTSANLVGIAERMEFGPERDRWLNAALVIDEASHTLYLDRPGDWLRAVVDYENDVDVPDDNVILGDLALTEIVAVPAPDPVSDEGSAAVAEPDGDRTDLPSAEPESDPVPDLEAEPEAEPEPEIPVLRDVSEEDPLRIWLGGDSLGQFMAAHIAYRIAPPDRTAIDIDYRISTGLARPDYFDWPAHMSTVISDQEPPEAIVYMVGGNDDQAMRLQSTRLEVATPEWLEEYRRRVGVMMDVTAYADTRLIWVLLPPMAEERRENISNQINEIITSQASQRPWVSAIDLDDLFVNDQGAYDQFVDDPQGEQQLARQADGVHITEAGSRWVADRLWDEIVNLWPSVSDDPGLSLNE